MGKEEETKTPRRTFSVSKEFESILGNIDSMPNMSRFVCEAIKEKLERVENPRKELDEALEHFMKIQQIIGNPQSPPANHEQASTEVSKEMYESKVSPLHPASEPVQKKYDSQEPKEEQPESQIKKSNGVEAVEKPLSTTPMDTDERKPASSKKLEPKDSNKQVVPNDAEQARSELKNNFLIPRSRD